MGRLLVPLARITSAALLVGLVAALAVGCANSDGEPDRSGSPSAALAGPDPEFVREAEGICVAAREEFTDLGESVSLDANDPDPVLEGLIRPGTRIYARQAKRLRDLTTRLEPTDAVSTYAGYFEMIDAVLNARLQVGQPGGPEDTAAHPLEARFQVMATEQSVAAAAAGLPGCAFDVNDTIFGS